MTPRVVVLSSPSGGGKTTIAKRILERYPARFGYSVSATTRSPREGEKEGQAYYFVSPETFGAWRNQGRFVETAEYAGAWYGTLKREVEKVQQSGRHVLLDIEVDGTRQVRSAYPDSIRIFILPASPRVLMQRLLDRKSESAPEIWRRVERAQYELGEITAFDRLVRNDTVDRAVDRVVRIVEEGGGFRREPGQLQWIEEFGNGLRDEAQRLYDQIHRR
ncbi:MAG: guanylate kinase [Gemmatimonadales bacterium]